MATQVTPESDPTNYTRLKEAWLAEKCPGYVVTNKTTYRAIQRSTDGVWIFIELDNKTMYDSTGF